MGCSCIVVYDTGDVPDFYKSARPWARRPHTCSECGRRIEPGEQYERVTAKWGDTPDTVKTCADCLCAREEFFCEGGFLHYDLWESIGEHISDTGTVDPDCLARLTPVARERVCEIIEEMWEDQEDEQ